MKPTTYFKDGQEALKLAGFDPGPTDGIPGARTLAATLAWLKSNGAHDEPPAPPVVVTPPTGTPVDARSEGIIATLHPQVQQPFRDLLHAINAAVAPLGVTGRWISGYRDEAQQNAEVAAGFSHAYWPCSAHNGGGGTVGFACDLGWFDSNGRYVEQEAATAIAVKTSRAMGFNPGADFGDFDHHCLRPPSLRGMGENQFIYELIRRHENSIPLWP